MTDRDVIGESDLDAYVDDQLDVSRRIEVEAYLSVHPAIAARVMADLRTRDELRLALAPRLTMAVPATGNAARRLNAALHRGAFLRRLRPLAAAAVLLTAGWVAHSQLGFSSTAQASSEVPEYVGVAIEAHRTSLLRATMYSQPEAPDYDREELLSGTAITMPELPADWQVTDVQVYPSKFGPSVGMAIEAGSLGTVSLFAARPGEFLVVPVEAEHVADITTAHWQIGEIAYALVGRAELEPLRKAALDLSETLY